MRIRACFSPTILYVARSRVFSAARVIGSHIHSNKTTPRKEKIFEELRFLTEKK